MKLDAKGTCKEWKDAVPDEQFGFAGRRSQTALNAWQQTSDTQAYEEFADMFIGWVYKQWEIDDNGGWTGDGKLRAGFMTKNMPGWVWMAFEH